jgi:hypothetical protein
MSAIDSPKPLAQIWHLGLQVPSLQFVGREEGTKLAKDNQIPTKPGIVHAEPTGSSYRGQSERKATSVGDRLICSVKE